MDAPVVWVVEERWKDRRFKGGWEPWHPYLSSLEHEHALLFKRRLQTKARLHKQVTWVQYRLVPYGRRES